jgi:cobalt/nickel transport system permease protein
MHMADALISPAVGGTMWVTTATLIGYCAKKVKAELDDRKIPLMGVLGAFIFASQMINFTIPATGSSGHLGGGLILAILLGPHAAFLVMASVLTIQALFFADGGLLALGCNIFNLGFFSCFIAYPLIYKRIVGSEPTKGRIVLGSSIAAIVGLQLGAFGVVLETLFSGISDLPFTKFVLLMQPIHLAIGFVEGIVTATVMIFIWQARPELLERTANVKPLGQLSLKNVLVGLLVATILIGGVVSWFASARPDGLEWAMFHTSGKEELQAPEKGIHSTLAKIQEETSFLPDYSFKKSETQPQENSVTWPAVDSGTSLSGLIGGAAVLILAVLIGFVLKAYQ